MTKDSYQDALGYSFKLLKIRLRSVKELKDKLKEKSYTPKVINATISELEKLDYLDDLKFAKIWISYRLSLNPKAPFVLRKELRDKGVSDYIVDTVLEETQKKYDFKEVAYMLAQKYIHRIKPDDTDKEKAKKRIFDYLRRRGFDCELIYEIIKEKLD